MTPRYCWVGMWCHKCCSQTSPIHNFVGVAVFAVSEKLRFLGGVFLCSCPCVRTRKQLAQSTLHTSLCSASDQQELPNVDPPNPTTVCLVRVVCDDSASSSICCLQIELEQSASNITSHSTAEKVGNFGVRIKKIEFVVCAQTCGRTHTRTGAPPVNEFPNVIVIVIVWTPEGDCSPSSVLVVLASVRT